MSETVRERHRRGKKGWGEGRGGGGGGGGGVAHRVNPQLFTPSGVFMLSSELELKSSHLSSNPR